MLHWKKAHELLPSEKDLLSFVNSVSDGGDVNKSLVVLLRQVCSSVREESAEPTLSVCDEVS